MLPDASKCRPCFNARVPPLHTPRASQRVRAVPTPRFGVRVREVPLDELRLIYKLL